MDLYRRDFTINTLAICLNPGDFGKILDFYGGQRDLRNKTIRVLHNLSFVEDPTRIIRAVRFESRFGFRISKDTEQLVKNAVKMSLLERVSSTRIFGELSLVFEEPHPAAIFMRLEELKLLEFFHPQFHFGPGEAKDFAHVEEVLAWYRLLYRKEGVSHLELYVMALLADFKPSEARKVMGRLGFSQRMRTKIRGDLAGFRNLLRRLATRRNRSPSQLYRLMAMTSREALLLLMALSQDEEIKRAVSDYLTTYSRITTHLKGKDLTDLGISPGPIYRKILNTLLYARLDGRAETREEEITLVKKKYRSYFAKGL
jgi:tRNA nucleotidyltransferase (CCA-adding enzyme)